MTEFFSAHVPLLTFAVLCVMAFALQALWLRKARSAELPWRLWVIAAALLLGTWFLAEQAGNRERQRIERVTHDAAYLYASEMEQRRHWQLGSDAKADDPLYLDLIKAEKRWLGLAPSVNDIYTLRKLPDGRNVFIVDSETDYDRDGKYEGDREQRTSLGEEYEEPDPALERAFRGEEIFASEPVTDRWGTWVSAFIPLLDPDGRVEAVLGADFEAKAFMQAISAAKWRVIGLMGIVQIVLLAASTLVTVTRAEARERQRTQAVLSASEQRYFRLIESLPVTVYTCDVEGRLTLFNKAAAVLWGRNPELGKDQWTGAWRMYTPAGAPLALSLNAMAMTLRGSRPTEASEFVIERPDGTRAHILSYPNLLCHPSGEVSGGINVCVDVTEQKRVEFALRESEEKLRLIFEHTDQVFYSHTADGLLTYLSPQAAKFFDCSSAELSQPWTNFLSDNPLNARGVELTRLAIETAESQTPYELELRTSQGRMIWVEVHESPVVVEGRTVALVGALTDITGRKQAEAIKQAEEERYLRQRNALIAVAHGGPSGEDLASMLRRLTEAAAKTMRVARVSVWRYNSDRTAIRCANLYELDADRHSEGFELATASNPAYFQSLARLDVISADNANCDAHTREFLENYLRPFGITSMLDTPISLGSVPEGVLCHEHVGPARVWTADEETFAVAVANLVSLALEGAERQRAEEELRGTHAQLEQMLVHSPAVTYRLKVEGEQVIPLAVSANIKELLGFIPAEASTQEWWLARLHPDDYQVALAIIPKTLGNGENRTEYRMRHKEDGYRWIEDSQRLLRDASGQPSEIIGIWMDVSDRRQAEQNLRTSEARIRAITDSAQDAILMMDPRGLITYWNPAAERIFGHTAAEALGQDLHGLIAPGRFHAAHHAAFPAFLKTGQGPAVGKTLNLEACRKDGSEISIQLSLSAVQIEDEWHSVGIMRDVTEIKRAEEELRWKNALLEAQVNSAPDGILVVDTQNIQVVRNDRFYEVWKIPARIAEDGDEKSLQSAANQTRNPQAFLDRVAYLYANADAISRDEIELVDGTVLDRYTSPVRDKGGKHYGRIWTFRDITDRKRAEASMLEMHQQLLESSREAGMAEVATTVLHNVGNVLNSVNVAAAVAADRVRALATKDVSRLASLLTEHAGDLPAFFTHDPRGVEIPKFLTQIGEHFVADQKAIMAEFGSLVTNIDHIKEIVAMQQSYSRAAGLIETLPPSQLIENALQLNAGALQRHEVEVVREYEDVPAVDVDKHKVIQILVNLIRNAKYAVDEGNPPNKRIRLCVRNGNDSVKMIVADNGIGIPPENLTRIFEHGFTTRISGHGFGLHSAALAAKDLKGSLKVESAGKGAGATFTLEVPIQRKEGVQ